MKVKVKPLNHVRLLATRWTATNQAPPSMGLSRQEYWSGLPLPSPIRYTTAFWIPAKPLHLRSMLSKSMRCIENYNTYSQHWSKEPNSSPPQRPSHNPRFRSWTNWARKLCLLLRIHLTSHQPTTTSSNILTTLDKHLDNMENASTTTWRQKINAFQEFVQSWSKDFYATGINRLISCWQKCDLLTVMVPILTTNDVFEPSYNDLKFMVWNDNYICTN